MGQTAIDVLVEDGLVETEWMGKVYEGRALETRGRPSRVSVEGDGHTAISGVRWVREEGDTITVSCYPGGSR